MSTFAANSVNFNAPQFGQSSDEIDAVTLFERVLSGSFPQIKAFFNYYLEHIKTRDVTNALVHYMQAKRKTPQDIKDPLLRNTEGDAATKRLKKAFVRIETNLVANRTMSNDDFADRRLAEIREEFMRNMADVEKGIDNLEEHLQRAEKGSLETERKIKEVEKQHERIQAHVSRNESDFNRFSLFIKICVPIAVIIAAALIILPLTLIIFV